MATRRASAERRAALTTLDDCLDRIRRAQANRRLNRQYAERSQVHLPALSLAVLAELQRTGPSRLRVLADRIDVDLPQVSREIKALGESGHVAVSVDPTDGRARVARLTESGAEQWAAYRAAATATMTEVVQDWDDRELAQFAALFDRFLGGATASIGRDSRDGQRTEPADRSTDLAPPSGRQVRRPAHPR